MTAGGHRIAIVGLGVVSALGRDPGGVHARLCQGESGVGALGLFDGTGQRTTLVAEVEGGTVALGGSSPSDGSWSRCDLMGVAAARDAFAPIARFRRGFRVGVAVGATTGGMFEAESVLASIRGGAVSQESIARLVGYPLSATAARIAEDIGGVERAATLSSACSSGAVAIAFGGMWLDENAVDCVLVGGVDGLCLLTLTGFNSLGATTTEACRPFDKARSGLVLGEAAAFLAMLREDTANALGAEVLAWLSGWAAGAEAFHLAHPNPSGSIPSRLMRRALETAGLGVTDVDYVNAHGTATPANDAMEAAAILSVFGAEAGRVSVSSSKPQLGHTLAAAGALEALITVEALRRQIVPPTIGLREPDPACTLRHVIGGAECRELRAALSNSFGFGGTGCVLALESRETPGKRTPTSGVELAVTGTVAVLGDGVLLDEALLAKLDPGPEPALDQAHIAFDPLARLDPERSRRFDRVTAVTTLAVAALLEHTAVDPQRVGLASGSAFGNVERTADYLKRLQSRGPRLANPAEFPHLVPSAPTGNASIYAGLTGPVMALADLDASSEAAWALAATCVRGGQATAMIAGGAEVHDPFVGDLLASVHGTAHGSRGEGGAWVMLEPRAAAQAEGRRCLALLLGGGQAFGGVPGALSLPPPRVPERLGVFGSGAAEALFGEAAHRGWGSAQHFTLPSSLGHHEALGAILLAYAVATIAAGRVDEALVLSWGRQQSYWFQFGRAEESQH